MAKKTILIADNSLINRTFLAGILSDDYNILEADDGQEALDTLRHEGSSISAMLLDLVMPGKDGYQVMSEMSHDPRLREIPVIVVTADCETTSEMRALDAGATDFLAKPIEPEIARRRIKFVVSQRELEELHIKSRIFERLQYTSDHDELTGIFSRSAFYRDTHEMLAHHRSKDYILVRWDIEKFTLVNELFGMMTGDMVLKAAGKSLASHVASKGTYGRYGSDNFVMCLDESCDVEELMAAIVSDIKSSFEDAGIIQTVILATGVFRITDPDLQVGKMCDRAGMALQTVKGNYTKHIAYYDDTLRKRLLEEQDILDNMEDALANGEFEAYLQPVYSISTERPASAEALVRWNRPGKGVISPGVFIPLFERNGFISKLDYNMWDQVCHIQVNRAAKGLPPIPISVNLSRRSAYNPHVYEDIVGLVEEHGVDPHLFRIEVTESAYMDNASQLISTVKKLQAYGFPVLMDDFGSGYSSFNTLKDIPVDMLKVDMKFMEGFERGGRTGIILAAILRMAKWLDIPVIAEGVETIDQYEFLRSIGCDYTQGFLFARPMPYADFEAHLASNSLVLVPERASSDAQDIADAMSSGHLFDRRLDSMTDAYAVCEFGGGSLEVVRASDGYLELFGYDPATFKTETGRMLDRVFPRDREIVVEACKEAAETGVARNALVTCRVKGDKLVKMHATFLCVGEAGVASALVVVAYRVVDSGDTNVPAMVCPLAPSNANKAVF